MKRIVFACFLLLAFTAIPLLAESKNPAAYPLRIHIFGRNETNFYHWRTIDDSEGEGRADLFEDGSAHGVDFSFSCSQKLKASFGFETYPAKWKKADRKLEVLMPVFGKPNSYWTCTLNTDVKDYAYFRHNSRLASESPADFKAWMVSHDYDPEHGKNVPVRLEPKPSSGKPSP